MPRQVLLATRSAGKLRELRAMSPPGCVWRGLDEFADVPDAVEDGETFLDNATRKALHYAAHTGLPTLADDSGLEVDALGGEPGVRSARFAGEPRDDAANNRLLVARLRGVPREARGARFRFALVLAVGARVLTSSEGVLEGEIVDEPRGDRGFGYDPHFWLPDRGRTLAELDAAEKNAISHRGRALRAMLPRIAALLPEA